MKTPIEKMKEGFEYRIDTNLSNLIIDFKMKKIFLIIESTDNDGHYYYIIFNDSSSKYLFSYISSILEEKQVYLYFRSTKHRSTGNNNFRLQYPQLTRTNFYHEESCLCCEFCGNPYIGYKYRYETKDTVEKFNSRHHSVVVIKENDFDLDRCPYCGKKKSLVEKIINTDSYKVDLKLDGMYIFIDKRKFKYIYDLINISDFDIDRDESIDIYILSVNDNEYTVTIVDKERREIYPEDFLAT